MKIFRVNLTGFKEKLKIGANYVKYLVLYIQFRFYKFRKYKNSKELLK